MDLDLEARGRDLVRRLAAAAEKMGQDVDQPTHDVETILAEAQVQIDPSSPTGQEMLDIVGLDMPSILVQFTAITHGSLRQLAETLLNSVCESCDPRAMFTAYMEALHSYSVPGSMGLCPILLDGLSKILTRLRRRRAEHFKESIPGLLKVAGGAADNDDRLRILDKLVHIVMVLVDSATYEEVTVQKQRLFKALGVFVLLLLARFSGFEQLDGSSAAESLMLQLSKLVSTCGFTYLNLVTGNFLEQVTDFLTEDLVDEDRFLREVKQGAAIAVWWRFYFDKAALDNQEAVTSIIGGLKSSRHAFVSALSSVSVLLSSNEKTWKQAEMGIDLLTLILEWGTVPSADNLLLNIEFSEDNAIIDLDYLLWMVERVVVYFPHSRTRQNAYRALVNIIRKVLPVLERFKTLKNFISECEDSSMISLMLHVLKEEVDHAISSKKKVQVQPLNTPFASPEVLDIIGFVLRPPNGGPPDLPAQMDAVLSALNLYRFLLIMEATGNSNYTGVLSHAKLEEACSKWLLPRRSFLEGFKRNFSADDPEVTRSVLLAISNLEGVLYRCIELAESRLKEHPK